MGLVFGRGIFLCHFECRFDGCFLGSVWPNVVESVAVPSTVVPMSGKVSLTLAADCDCVAASVVVVVVVLAVAFVGVAACSNVDLECNDNGAGDVRVLFFPPALYC